MAITIKEIKVVTTVTRNPARDSQLTEETLRQLKREIIDELKRLEQHNKRRKTDYER